VLQFVSEAGQHPGPVAAEWIFSSEQGTIPRPILKAFLVYEGLFQIYQLL